MNESSVNFCKICGFDGRQRHGTESESKTAESVSMASGMASGMAGMGGYDAMQQQIVMNYHYNAYQSIFLQLQNATSAPLGLEQVQQLQVMANYHFQQYSMSNELMKLQAQMNQLQPALIPRGQQQMKQASAQMTYVKLERYFLLQPQQQQLLIDSFAKIKNALAAHTKIDIVDA